MSGRDDVRRGVRIGVDVGDVRIGVARSDPSGLIATPVETVARGTGDLARLAAIAAEEDAVEVVVGLPRSLSGGEGPAAAKVRAFAAEIAAALAPVPVRLCDERLSTVTAESATQPSTLAAKSRLTRSPSASTRSCGRPWSAASLTDVQRFLPKGELPNDGW